jgi:hypothetical protein
MKVILQKVVRGKAFLSITSLKKQHISYFLVGKWYLSEISNELLKKSYDLKKMCLFHALVGFNWKVGPTKKTRRILEERCSINVFSWIEPCNKTFQAMRSKKCPFLELNEISVMELYYWQGNKMRLNQVLGWAQ